MRAARRLIGLHFGPNTVDDGIHDRGNGVARRHRRTEELLHQHERANIPEVEKNQYRCCGKGAGTEPSNEPPAATHLRCHGTWSYKQRFSTPRIFKRAARKEEFLPIPVYRIRDYNLFKRVTAVSKGNNNITIPQKD
jgi:hypothetical protein